MAANISRPVIAAPTSDQLPRSVTVFCNRVAAGTGVVSRDTVSTGYWHAAGQSDFQPDQTVFVATGDGVVGFGGPLHAPVGFIARLPKGFAATANNLDVLAGLLRTVERRAEDDDLGVGNSQGFRRFLGAALATAAHHQSGVFRTKFEVFKTHLQNAGVGIDIFPLVSPPQSPTPPVIATLALVLPLEGVTEPVVTTADFDLLLNAALLTTTRDKS